MCADSTILSGSVLSASPASSGGMAELAPIVGGVTECCALAEVCP